MNQESLIIQTFYNSKIFNSKLHCFLQSCGDVTQLDSDVASNIDFQMFKLSKNITKNIAKQLFKGEGDR